MGTLKDPVGERYYMSCGSPGEAANDAGIHEIGIKTWGRYAKLKDSIP